MITAERFTQATGAAPENDDLERVNCPKVGTAGHRQCGWCEVHEQPHFAHSCEETANEQGEAH